MNSVKYIHQIIFSFILLLIFPGLLVSQFELNHCGFPVDSIIIEDPIQSSIAPGGYPDIAIDGVVTGSVLESSTALTHQEENPYWQARLTDIHQLYDIQIHYPADHYPSGLGNFYILTSEFDIFSGNLDEDISNPLIQSVHVNTNIPNGSTIPLTDHYAQYVQIQAADFSSLGLTEVNILGYIVVEGGDDEICGNGEDDDCDGRIDCEDPDCGPIIINANGIDPTCPLCADGQITVNIEYVDGPWDLEYSLDGGVTFVPFNQNGSGSALHLFDEVLEGVYTIVVSNGNCMAEIDVEISAPRGDHNACINGSFEDGTFEGWTGESGLNQAGNLVQMSQGFNSQFEILPSSSQDPNVGNVIPFDLDNIGEYFLRMEARPGNEGGPSPNTGNNNPFMNAEYHKINYCFDVSEENADFNFKFALVLQNPADHSLITQPFFRWEIRDEVNSSILHSSSTIFADASNEFFQVIEWPNLDNAIPEWLGFDRIVYRGWTCQNADLRPHIGTSVCASFLISGCSENGHGGYVYLDGLCANSEEAGPKLDLDIKDVYCQNQNVDIILQNSENYDRYSLKVCRYINGNPTECFFTDEFIRHNGDPKLHDILGWYFAEPHNPNTPLSCDDRFQVTVFADNECSIQTEFIAEFVYVCSELTTSYPDIYTCLPNTNLLIEGNAENQNGICGTCLFEWTPSQYLDDPSFTNPTILGDYNNLADDQIYEVTVTDTESGCVETDNVSVFAIGFDELPFTVTTEIGDIDYIDNCNFKARIIAHFDSPVDPSEIRMDVLIYNSIINYGGIVGTTSLVSPNQTGSEHEFELDLTLPRKGLWSFTARVYDAIGEMLPAEATYNDACVAVTEVQGAHTIHSALDNNIYIPNSFSPNDDGHQDFFHPYFGDNSGIFHLRVLVTYRWGGVVFDSGHRFAPLDSPGFRGDEPEFRWDGRLNGEFPNPTVYTYVVAYSGCFVSLPCNPDICGQVDGDDCADVCAPYDPVASYGNYGDVTVIR